jgi:hypothetical protein
MMKPMPEVLQQKNRIALVQIWFGNLPDYFEYHYETCLNQRIDFFFFTDQDVDPKYNSENFKFIKISMQEIEDRLLRSTSKDLKITSSYKLCEIKPTYADLFNDYLSNYEFVGWYDIDTLFGDILHWMEPYMDDFDLISFGEDSPEYNRPSGPLTIMRNTAQLRKFYRNDFRFFDCMEKPEYAEYDEHVMMKTIRSMGIPTKIIFGASNMESGSYKIRFDAVWTGGKVYVEGEEKMVYHFWRKKLTKFTRKGNTIVAEHKIDYIDDFYYITYFTKNYEPLLRTLIKSLERYSTRRCVLYTVNYTTDMIHELSDQFIVRRIDITGDDWLDKRGRSFNTITSKPMIGLESLNAFPGKRFVFLDTDIYCTVNIDSIGKYFNELENYPLTNSHVHDVIYCIETGEYVDSLAVLGEELGVSARIFPRRKTNVMLYDERSRWFFQEQMDIYNFHKDSTRPGIFKYHDEDTFNVILAKYNLRNSLPVVDIEEVYSIDLNHILNYSYSETPISELARIPKSDQDVYVFHGYKKPEQFQLVDSTYAPTVLNKVDMLVYYNGKDVVFEKNSFLREKKIKHMVLVQLLDGDRLVFNYEWNILTSQFFYMWDMNLPINKVYTARLLEKETGRLLFRSEVKH